MKTLRFVSFAALAVLLSSCAEMTSVDNTDEQTNTIAAVMEGIQTKTSTTDEGRFSWSEGDNIWLETTAGDVIGTLATGDGTQNATFNFGAFTGELTGRSVYPYNTGHSVEDDVLSVVLPASYNLGSNLENTNAPMYGVNINGTLKFNHLAGVMRFAFKNVPAGVDKFTITVDKKINGLFEADLTADYPVLQTESTNVVEERTVTINFDAIANTSDIKLFVPLPLGTYESLELALYKGEEAIWNYSKAVTNTVNRKSLKLMPAVSMGGSIGGEIEGGDTPETPEEEIHIEATNSTSIYFSWEGLNEEYVYYTTNATEIIVDIPEDATWITNLVNIQEEDRWFSIFKIEENKTTEERKATVKIYGSVKQNKYLEYHFTQQALDFAEIPDTGEDLSKNETSNCYIISEPGSYKFIPTKGNNNMSIGNISRVEVLWESFGTSIKPTIGELIKDVTYNNNYIEFNTAAEFKEGNAVIAAKDGSGNILWSWHIWMTDKPIEYRIDYGIIIMDRNIGATSSAIGAIDARGLFYQWGRKDPFLGEAASTIDWPTAVEVSATSGTVEYVTLNPTTFISTPGSSANSQISYDWHYASRDNTLWSSNKSIYDPCPVGWRVPDSDKLARISARYDETNYGLYWNDGELVWIPCAGYIYNGDGLYTESHTGQYWCTSNDNSLADTYYISYNVWGTTSTSYRSEGASVRCIRK